MTRRDVHAAGAGVHRDKISCEHDRFAIKKRVSRGDLVDFASGKGCERFTGWLELCCEAKRVHKPIGEEQRLGNSIALKFLNYVNFLWIDSDREIRGQRPWRGCPNRNACFSRQFAAYDRKLDVNGGVIAFLIFHFGFSERRLCASAPKDRLLRLINETFLNKHCESAQNFRFVFGIHRQIWMFPIAQDTESLELFALDVDKLPRECFRPLADFERRKPA